MDPHESLIGEYYACFNERRLDDMGALFTDDAVFEQLQFRRQEPGRSGRIAFARAWLAAFPDGVLTIEQATSTPRFYEVSLLATGTHDGALDLGGWVFQRTGDVARLRVRELLEIRDGRVVFSSLSFDLQAMVEQLAKVDSGRLLNQLDRIQKLGDELAAAQRDPMPRRDVIDQLGLELDAARHTVRPYYKQR
jgi:ketosteroid isomerase-like protein